MSRVTTANQTDLEIELGDLTPRTDAKSDQKIPQQPPKKPSQNQAVVPAQAPVRLFAASYDFLCKLMLVGDPGVGKGELILRYTDDSYSTSFITTTGIDFKMKTIPIDNKRIKLQIWDTAGQECFRSITNSYYRGTMGIMLVYSVTDEKSFQGIKYWHRQCKENAHESVEFILVGSKCENAKDRVVSFEAGQALAKSLGIPNFFECSAKTNINVDQAFTTLVEQITKKLELRPRAPNIELAEVIPPKRSGCAK